MAAWKLPVVAGLISVIHIKTVFKLTLQIDFSLLRLQTFVVNISLMLDKRAE